jgi:threonine dehydratase
MDIAGEVIAAEKTISPYIRETYLEYSPFYSRMTGAQVYFKLENLQHTGSFKLRGAMNKLLSLTDEEKGRGVVTASTGNHGAAFAFGLSKDDYITVTEEEIKESLREFMQTQHMLIEGSAAVAVAAFKKQADRFAGLNVVVVICGGNISLETLKTIL